MLPVFRDAHAEAIGSRQPDPLLFIFGETAELHARVPDQEKCCEISLPVRAGSVILFHSMLLHASHPNSSDRDRLAYITSYMGADYTFGGSAIQNFWLPAN